MKSKVVPKEDVPIVPSDAWVAYEKDLPYPFVHYPSRYDGAFLGFQRERDEPVFHCSCQRKGLEVYMLNEATEGLTGVPKAVQKMVAQDFFDQLWFKDSLCHICNQVCPAYGYGKGDSETKFYQIYGFYIHALMYEYGVSGWGAVYDGSLIPADIVHQLIAVGDGYSRLDRDSLKDFIRYCEDVVRCRMGYFGIGKKWTTEMKLLELVRKVFPSYTVVHQYPLDHLKADIFVEKLRLVVEYQGEQHYHPFDRLGGKEGLRKIQERDLEKAKLCKYYGYGLVYFTYQEQITEKLVKERIGEYVKKGAETKT